MTDHQHFVSQAVLRNFSSSNRKKKENHKIFVILHINNQLTIQSNPIVRTFEQNQYFTTNEENYDSWFKEIDAQSPSIIASIIKNGVENLNLQEREKINKFMAFQWLRCVAIRNESISYSKILGEDCINCIKNIHADLFTDIKYLIKKFNNLTLSSVSPKSLNIKHEYVISGSPVLYNVLEPEFYFPISPTNCLRFHSIDSSLSPLDSRFLNELQFINGGGYNGFRVAARHQETLEYLKNTPLKYCEIQNLENSFWKHLFLEMYKTNQEAKKVSG
ncbi:DUF4238 domain-containing protein [Microcoleus sp. S28C3]|uniref:DUF4238 domain-containing protein n=1 Tax=Microcoleus sp. S28C3 TaxID=3055414 RepID=UPI002FCF22BC